MGFDVVYLTPIHPIGQINRKGRNNAVKAAEGDPGSPYAIGSADGGHDAVHPELGTLEDFRGFVAACRQLDMEVALDFAVQCSPTIPGSSSIRNGSSAGRTDRCAMRKTRRRNTRTSSIRILHREDAGALWNALRDVILFWIDQGVKHLPGRQSPHQAVPVLGMADP